MTRKGKRRILAVVLSACMAVGFALGTLPGMTARAEGEITIVLDNINSPGGYAVDAAGGKVELSLDEGVNFAQIDDSSLAGAAGENNGKRMYTFSNIGQDGLHMKLTPNEGKEAVVNGLNHGPEQDGTYKLAAGDSIHVEFRDNNPGGGGNPPGPGSGSNHRTGMIFDLQLSYRKADGTTGDAVLNRIDGDNTVFSVPADFDFNQFDVQVLAITKVDLDEQDQDGKNVVLENTDYAGNTPNKFCSGWMTDNEGRDAFEIMTHTDKDRDGRNDYENIFQGGICFHGESPANTENFPGFYLMFFTLQKTSYRGVSVRTVSEPDMFDFASYNSADLAATSEDAPEEVTCYYGDRTIQLQYDGLTEPGTDPVTISRIEDYDLPSGAVSINQTAGTVTVNSDFFDRIPLKITLSDGTVGYMTLKRIGIELAMNGLVDGTGHEVTHPFHGASGWGADFPAAYQGKHNLTAVFYHGNDENDNAYEMIAILEYRDGSTETRIVQAYGGRECHDTSLRGSDYILWSDSDPDKAPVAAYVTAVPAGSLSGSSFGGCTFGSGAGVEWTSGRQGN